jgi:hypothetical protein
MNKTFQTASLSTPMLGVLAMVTIVGMLTAFHSVVQGAAQNGELRRQAAIRQADAIWRCKILPDLTARAACLLQINAPAESSLSGAMHASALN